jgi:hypothetical protein
MNLLFLFFSILQEKKKGEKTQSIGGGEQGTQTCRVRVLLW